MRSMIVSIVIGLLVPAGLLADEGDDTLRFYLSKSELVVSAEFLVEPSGHYDEMGVINYVLEVKVLEVLKGKLPAKANRLRLSIVRFEMKDEDKHPSMKKGSRCILFLKSARKGSIPAWTNADMWFAVQPHSPWMARSLKRLAG